MNIRQISTVVIGAMVGVIGTLIAINVLKPTTVIRDKQVIDIEYEVNAAADKLGCFRIKKNNKGWIRFVFNGDAEQWVLNQFTLCPGDTKIVDACLRDLTLDEQMEFAVMNDPQGTNKLQPPPSGQVKLTGLVAGSKEFYLFDQNTIEQTYFYNIKVCQQAAPTICLTLDPPVENKGLK
jgi:hypothetical protein